MSNRTPATPQPISAVQSASGTRPSSSLRVATLIASGLAFAAMSFSATAQDTPSWKSNLRLSVDAASRSYYYPDAGSSGTQHAIGIDAFKVFSSDTRDIGTLVAQVYFTHIDGVRARPGFFDSDTDSEFVFRIFNFNFTGLGKLAPNVRIGHMEVPFGLEHTVDTNGSLRQYAQGRNLGVKADWGISLNKQHKHFEYEIAATTGGIQALTAKDDDSYVYSARVGTLRDANFVIGGSIYRSQLNGIERRRGAIDAQAYFGKGGVALELSGGTNDGAKVRSGLAEFNYRLRRETWLLYSQVSWFQQDRTVQDIARVDGNLGVHFMATNQLTFSAQYARTLKHETGNHPSTLSIQARFRL